MSVSIKVLFFASLREELGISRTELMLNEPMTALGIWEHVTGKAQLPSAIRIACNHRYCEASTLVHAGDELAFFPPVTGG